MPNKFECIVEQPRGKLFKIAIWDDLEKYEDYDKLIEQLEKITEHDQVELKISSPGGRCSIGYMLYDRFKELPCWVDVIIPYPSYSMGAILALCGDTLTINPGAFIMFHDYSTGAKGKGNEIYKSTEAYMESFSHRFNKICQPFFTKKECEDILNGQDMYVKWNDNNLEARIKRHFK
jgi:ATP-dependent protease ClpP protease subunit